MNKKPNAEQLAEIGAAAVEVATEHFGRKPRVAFLSYSDFGSAQGDEPRRVRQAIELFRHLLPDVPVDGEMQADTAVRTDLLRSRRPDVPAMPRRRVRLILKRHASTER